MNLNHNVIVNTQDTSLTQVEILSNKIISLQKKIKNIQVSNNKTYTTQDLFPYPFHTSLYMPNFPKYKGKRNHIKYITEFSMDCIDLAHEPTYLMRLFPRIIMRQELEWFSH
jgi:hypothetical protein